MPTIGDNFVPVSQGRSLGPDDLRADMDSLGDLTAKSDLDVHIVQLLTLHPQLQVRFRNQDLSRLDVSTKQSLLQDMNDVLGIKPLRSTKR